MQRVDDTSLSQRSHVRRFGGARRRRRGNVGAASRVIGRYGEVVTQRWLRTVAADDRGAIARNSRVSRGVNAPARSA